MRIVQVTPGIYDESSGPSHSVPGLCKGLAANGCAVSLHCLDRIPDRLRDAPYEIVCYPFAQGLLKRVGHSPAMLEGLRKAARSADIMHCNGMWMMPDVYPSWAVKGTNCKFVVAPRGSLAERALARGKFQKLLFGPLWQYPALRSADMFHATCEKEFKEIRRAGYRQPVAIVPVGLDIPLVGKASMDGAEARCRQLVFFGRLHAIKGVDRLLYAWERLHGRLPDWEVVVAGPDCGLLPTLQTIVSERKLPRVRFVGELNGAAKYEFLSSADLYVLPTETENFGITIAEALACGTPVITTKGAPWGGLVAERCGWWINNDVDSLTESILDAANLPREALRQMGESGRKWIERDFTWTGVGAKMKQAYGWLLGAGERPDWVHVD